MNLQQQDKSIYTLEKQPVINERVIVITPKFRCLGYWDGAGNWRHDKDGAPIAGVVRWTRNRRP